MKVLVVCSGTINFELNAQNYDYIIAIDGGYNHLKKANLTPNLYIGDEDSAIGISDFKNKIVAPTNKDETDFKLFINWYEKHQEQIDLCHVFGITGRRQDHFLAILIDLVPNIILFDEFNQIMKINNNQKFEQNPNYKYISFFTLKTKVQVTLEGFKYDVSNEIINNYDTRFISNEIKKAKAKVITNDEIIVIRSNDKKNML